jgi:hypothetical protein
MITSKIFKNTRSLFIAIACVLSTVAAAQMPNANLFSTATNSSGTGTLSTGALDLNWTAAMGSSIAPYNPAVVVGVQPGWSSSPWATANWVVFNHTCSTMPASHYCDGTQVDEYYRLVFNLPAQVCGMSISTGSAYCMNMDFMADNCIKDIWVNGVLSYSTSISTPSNHTGFLTSNRVSVALCNNWTAGSNTLIVHNVSGSPSPGGLSGFLAFPNNTLNTSYGIPLTSTFTANNAPCTGMTGGATVTPSGGGGGYTYSWIPSGSTTNVSASLTPGIYTVLITSALSCSTTQTVSITQPPTLSLNITSASPTACAGSNISFTATSSGGTPGYSYMWNASQFGAVYNGVSQVAGPVVFTVTSGDMNSCTITKTVSGLFLPTPTLSVSGNTICAGTTGTLMASGGISYTWSPLGTSGNSYTVNPVPNTSYVVAGSDGTCVSFKTVTLNILPVPLLAIAGVSICSNVNGTLIASGASSYVWYPPVVSGATLSVPPVAGAVYTVVGTANNCSAAASAYLVVLSAPVLSVTGYAVCTGVTATMAVSGASSFTWWPVGYQGNTYTVNAPAGSVFTVTGFANGCESTETVQITQAPTHTVNISGPKTFCKGEKIKLVATGASLYTWSNSGIGPTLLITPTATGVYSVTGTGSLCASNAFYTVSLISCTSVDDLKRTDLMVFPNPVQDHLFLELGAQLNDITITIYDLSGLKVYTSTPDRTDERKLSVDVSALLPGFYVLKCSDAVSARAIRFLKE